MRRAALVVVLAAVVLLGAALASGATFDWRRDRCGERSEATAPAGHERATVVWQDQGPPGPDGCDLEPVPEPGVDGSEPLVLGYDCAFRDEDGSIVATTDPTTRQGGCPLLDR